MTAPPPDNAASAVLDPRVLEKLVGADPARLRKYARLFTLSMDEVLPQVDAALSRHDNTALAALGHRGKSTARNMGALALAEHFLQLEQAARGTDLTRTQSIVAALRPALAEVQAALQRQLPSA